MRFWIGIAGHHARKREVHRDRDPRREDVETDAAQDQHDISGDTFTMSSMPRSSVSSGSPRASAAASHDELGGQDHVALDVFVPSSIETNASTATSPRMLPDWRMVVERGIEVASQRDVVEARDHEVLGNS